MATDTKKYLEYLDKEMTIMGILSGVTVTAPAGILGILLGDKNPVKEQFLAAGPFFVIGGSAFCILSALFFYKQRSLLAWYYGQMCLVESLDDSTAMLSKLRQYIRGADSWETWIPYSWGFTALIAAFVEYLSAAFFRSGGPELVVVCSGQTRRASFSLLSDRLRPPPMARAENLQLQR